MHGFRRLIIIASLFSSLQQASAQKALRYSFRYLTQSDGLLHNEVLAVSQDNKGFIWIATPNGLQRYDGAEFLYFPDMLGNGSSGYANGVEIYNDKKADLLWINSFSTMEVFEPITHRYHPAHLADSNLSSTSVGHSFPRGPAWKMFPHALVLSDSTGNKAASIYYNSYEAGAFHSAYYATDANAGLTWFSTLTGLRAYDQRNGNMYTKEFNPLALPLLSVTGIVEQNWFRFFMLDSKRSLWMSSWDDKLYRYDLVGQKLYTYSLHSIIQQQHSKNNGKPLVNCMIEDNHHIVWIGTEGAGLLRYDATQDKFDFAADGSTSTDGVRYHFKIFNLFQDKEENIWVATDNGISMFNPYQTGFTLLKHEPDIPSLPKYELTSFLQVSNGDCYLSTWGGGVSIYDSSLQFRKTLVFDGDGDNNRAWSLVQADQQTLWIGCQHGRLQILDLFSNTSNTLRPPELEGSTVISMQKDGKGNIWLGLYNGHIVKWDAATQTFIAPVPSNRAGTIGNVQVNNILIDDNVLWASTATGFLAFDTRSNKMLQQWLPNENDSTAISGKFCEGIEKLNDSVLMIGTVHGGINFFNTRRRTFSHRGLNEGFPSNTVIAIRKRSAHEVWFTTDFGIYKFDPTQMSIPPVNMGPLQVASTFSATNIYQLRNAQWLTFNTSEVFVFNPAAVSADLAHIAPVITGFSVLGKSQPIDSLLRQSATIRLSYKENFFAVSFALLLHSRQQQVNYLYRLKGIDDSWVRSGTRRAAIYTDLRAGTYIFEVKATDGTHESDITSFTIRIVPPFWQTTWFIVLMTVLVLASIFWWIKRRDRDNKMMTAQKMKVQQLNADRLRQQLELEQITNFFSTSLIDKTTVDDVLWDVARNLIGRLGFVDCMIYLWNEDHTRMVQKAGYGPKGSIEEINKQVFDVQAGQGVVGHVMATQQPLVISDTTQDSRYRVDEMSRLSEITVPIMYNNELIGIIDSEHHDKNFFQPHHLQVLSTIATLVANKIISIQAEQSLRQKQIEIYGINEQLSLAKLEALRSQMNPHFIFNCINSIDALIQSNDKYRATVYLNKFAKLLRNILDGSRQNTVLFSNDIATTRLYVELEQLRHENRFVSFFRIDEELLREDYKVPSLVIQPFVENAIIHGLKNKKDNAGVLDIDVKRVQNSVRYVITDNGIGRKAAGALVQTKTSHLGVNMSNERIKLFNKQESATVEIHDLYDGETATGTSVVIYLNFA